MTIRERLTRRVAVALLFALMLSVAQAQWSVPDALQSQVSELNDEQRDFITSGAILKIIPERQLLHELGARDADSLRKLVDDLMAVAAQMAYDPQRDMGAAPLNIASKRFNGWTMPTPAPLRDFERDDGPFSVHRYIYPRSGVPTFGGAKVAIWPEDLTAGNVDVAIVGIPSNMSSGRRDAGSGPGAMRGLNTIATPDVQSLISPMLALSVVDYGDFSIDNMSVERTVNHVTNMVAQTAGTGAIPMLVGGDTSMLYPGVKGIAQAHGAASFGLLHLSAHPDAARAEDHTVSDRQAIFLLIDQEIVNGSNVVQVGLRGPAVDADTLQWLRSKQVRYHTMAEVQQRGLANVLKRVRREVDKGPDTFFVSVDVSIVDPAEMIAAGRTSANGIGLAELTQTIRHVCAAKDIVGFEITDMAPMLDYSRLSTVNANALLNACLVGIAVRKAGLKPDYVHPLALDHGQR